MDANTSGREIFVVDDDPAVRETLSIVLSAAGYQSICFADGDALLAVARSRCPACILLDVHIPGRSGLDILEELHAEDYPAPIFMISGKGDIAMAVNAIKNGALDFIEKPFRGIRNRDPGGRGDRGIHPPARAGLAPKVPSLNFPGREPLTHARTRGAGSVLVRQHQQGSRTAARDQPAHHRVSPRQHHEEARRQERHRSGSDRDVGDAESLSGPPSPLGLGDHVPP